MQRLLLLEHLNLTVADKALAVAFYVEGLGCRLNSVIGSERITHVNFGLSQFHLPQSSAKDTSQTWNGFVCLVTTEPLVELAARLEGHPRLAEHGGVVVERIHSDETNEGDLVALTVTGPYGNVFRIQRDQSAGHAFSHLGHHFGDSGTVVAMSKVVHYCQPGTARGIANFYKRVFGLEARLLNEGAACQVLFEAAPSPETRPVTGAEGEEKPPGAPAVHHRQTLEFRESAQAQPRDNYERSDSAKYHLAIYLPTDESYEAAFERAQQHGLLYFNEAFRNTAPEFGSSMTREEAMKYRQFRLKNMYYAEEEEQAPESAGAEASGNDNNNTSSAGGGDVGARRELLLMLEHEVRAPSHRANPMLRVTTAAARKESTDGSHNP